MGYEDSDREKNFPDSSRRRNTIIAFRLYYCSGQPIPDSGLDFRLLQVACLR